MPQQSALYGVARIRTHERGLIGREKMMRLVELNASEVLRQLIDAGYGSLPDAGLDDIEALIASELSRTYELVQEVTSDQKTTDVFFLAADVHNLKLLIKRRLKKTREEPVFMKGGLYPVAVLMRCVEEREYEELMKELREPLEALERELEHTIDPARISYLLDSAYLSVGLSSKNRFVVRYFQALADFNNALTLLRMRGMGAAEPDIRKAFLPEGQIDAQRLNNALSLEGDDLAETLATGDAQEYLKRGLLAAVHSNALWALERERDNYLMSLVKQGKNDIDTIAPIVGYLLAREQEAKCLRLILTLKRNNVDSMLILERLRELYG